MNEITHTEHKSRKYHGQHPNDSVLHGFSSELTALGNKPSAIVCGWRRLASSSVPGLGGALSARGARGAAGAPGVREWLGLADSRPPAPWVSAVGCPRLFPCGLNYSCLPVHVPETMFSGCIWKPKSLRFVWTGFYLRRRRVRLWLAEPGPASCAEVTTPWGSCHTGPCSPWIQVPRGMLLSPLGAPNGTRSRGGESCQSCSVFKPPSNPGEQETQRRLKGQRQTNHG